LRKTRTPDHQCWLRFVNRAGSQSLIDGDVRPLAISERVAVSPDFHFTLNRVSVQ
jgi:hypothetical protein